MIPVDNHLHTRLCGHATGEVEEYIEAAVRMGIREVGFCDHLPLYFLSPGKTIPGCAMDKKDLPRYVEMIRRCAKKAPIPVKLGIEADYVPGYEEELASLLSLYPFDYVTGSVHFIDGWGFDNPAGIVEYDKREIDLVYEQYFSLTMQAASTGFFDVMAHPDLIKKFNFRPVRDLKLLYEKTARAFKKAGVCVEVNTAGLRYPAREIYPGPELLEIFFRHGLPITLGSDAHSPDQVGAGLTEAVEFVKGVGYTEIVAFSGRRRRFVKI